MMDAKKVEQLVKLAQESAISELTVRRDGALVSIRKAVQTGTVKAAPKVVDKSSAGTKASVTKDTAPEEEGTIITAPMVGIFHLAEGIRPGLAVHAGHVVGLIESMKLMNEIRSPSDGVLSEDLIESGTPVEYGQILFRLKND